MMPLLWVVLWSTLPPLVLLCGSDCCIVHESSSSHNVSPLLKSLQCHNNYESYVQCKWKEHRNKTLQLWFKTENNNRKQCVPYGADVQDASEYRTFQCRYKARAFSMGIKHTAFFLENMTLTLCSSVPHKPLDLSLHLRTRPPVTLSTHGAGDGGRRLASSPHPSSSSLNKHITTKKDTNASVKLEKRLLLPGQRYEASVKAQEGSGQRGSVERPVVTKQNAGQFPSLHCVLDGEKEVMCSWEVSREVAHFITYQLACRHHQTAPSERCCVNPTINSDLSRAVLRYSCSLTVTDPTAHLFMELQPAHNAKTFRADQHIRPNPPQQVKVMQKDSNWMVVWTDSSTASKIKRLYYQVCYYRTQYQGSSVLVNVSEGFKSLNIPGASLAPSQRYQVKVRTLVVPVDYKGIPSEWTDPVEWTSNEATWSLNTLIYIIISVFVATLFFTLYCTIPACRRRAVLWVDSVPSPSKSKILSDIKSTTSWTLMQNENMTVCKVLRLDNVSTGSSDALLWPTKDTAKKCLEHLEQDEGSWKRDNLPSAAEKVNGSDTSSMSFSGPYIFCEVGHSQPVSFIRHPGASSESKPADVKCEEKEEEQETSSDITVSPSPMNFILFGEGYVCLPGFNVSRSTQDLVSHSDANTNTHRHGSAEPDQQCPDKMDVQQSGLSEPPSIPQPPAYTSGPFSPWPHGGTDASGYCRLPAAFMTAAK